MKLKRAARESHWFKFSLWFGANEAGYKSLDHPEAVPYPTVHDRNEREKAWPLLLLSIICRGKKKVGTFMSPYGIP